MRSHPPTPSQPSLAGPQQPSDGSSADKAPTIERTPKGWTLDAAVWLPRRRDEVFPFFAEARNLERLTPPWLTFRVLSGAGAPMRDGLVIDYALRVRGVPLRWRSRIVRWEPPNAFVDEQERGPYAFWRHLHTFEVRGEGVLCADRVDYRPLGGPLAPIVHRLFVERDLRRIFEYRQKFMRQLFGA